MSIKQGDYLKKLRTENNLSQEKLAEKLGVSRQSVSKWEQGYAVPDTDNMLKLSKLYGLSVDAILNCGESAAEPAPKNNIPTPAAKPIHETVSEQISKPQTQNTKSSENSADEHEDQPVGSGQNTSYSSAKEKPEKKKRSWVFAAYPFIAIFVMIALGVFNSSLWKSSWVFLLTIPLFYTGIIAKEKKNLLIFFYPAVVLIVFFIGGFHFGLWHPLWILFLTIPIYYIGAAFAVKNKKNKK